MITKKQFIEAAKRIKNPSIKTFSNPSSPLLSQCFTLIDKSNCRNDLYLGGCQLSQKEYDEGNADSCIARIEVAENKFNRWLKEAKNLSRS